MRFLTRRVRLSLSHFCSSHGFAIHSNHFSMQHFKFMDYTRHSLILETKTKAKAIIRKCFAKPNALKPIIMYNIFLSILSVSLTNQLYTNYVCVCVCVEYTMHATCNGVLMSSIQHYFPCPAHNFAAKLKSPSVRTISKYLLRN